ncbi:MAG: hypothetical protein CL755_13400 [Chloroflexi bacterium]|nr:hypothetical protein [Chloroflexota bacterium]
MMKLPAPVRRINFDKGESTPWPYKEDSTTGAPSFPSIQLRPGPNPICKIWVGAKVSFFGPAQAERIEARD